MSCNRHLTRRSFLRISAYVGFFGVFVPLRIFEQFDVRPGLDPLTLKLASYHFNRASAKRIGETYLRSIPSEADIPLLVSLICPADRERIIEFETADLIGCRKLLKRRLRQDFENGQMVDVQGWILSKTEIRLCALAALT